VAWNFQSGYRKIKQLTEYENVTQKVLFNIAALPKCLSGRKYEVIIQNGDCSRESSVPNLDPIRVVRHHPILRRLISSCGDTLRTLFTSCL
jgi:hypothetical protein